MEVQADSECFELLQLLWHQGSGAWAAPAEYERDDLVELVTELAEPDDPDRLVDRYAALIASCNKRVPAIDDQLVYVEKTQVYHKLILARRFLDLGMMDAARLAAIAVDGGDAGEAVGRLWCVDEATVRRIGEGVRGADIGALLSTLRTFPDEAIQDELDWMSPEERREHLQTMADDEDLRGELENLVHLYSEAGRTDCVVLIG